MKAIVYTKYGTPDTLELKEVDKPIPKDNEVLIKVYAVSINDWDFLLLEGKPFINRIPNGFFSPKKQILGFDISGRVEEVGKNVKRFHVGDEVYGDLSGGWGGFAEYVCAQENALVLKPTNITFEEAAATAHTSMLAFQGLEAFGQIKRGQKILINGAGGGVGTFAVQIAKLYGAEVTGVDRSIKIDMMLSMGFDHVIDYTKEDFTRSTQLYDMIFDVKSNHSIFDYLSVLSPKGIYASIGGSATLFFQALLLGPVISLFTKKKVCTVFHKPNRDLASINRLFEEGKIRPVIDKVYKLSEVPEAMQYYKEGNHKGKIVISLEKP